MNGHRSRPNRKPFPKFPKSVRRNSGPQTLTPESPAEIGRHGGVAERESPHDSSANIITPDLPLTPGTRLGPYEVLAAIGAGGMGEVYRATDTKLKRQVAIKILPPSLAADHDRLARFQREAEVLASLNHPNIAGIYGLEDGGGVSGLVMELVEGDDLSQRIARGPIPIDEALPIARQIAEALEAAHEQGIIHRDLKPANIKVRTDGTVKVLDFGLAKAMEPTGAMAVGAGASQSPTITSPVMTSPGMILGTAAYMSPEQAKGRAVDRRADVWAFGAVVFEMLTGRRAFAGDDVTDVLASVLAREPEWARLPASLSPGLGSCLRRCLHKEPKQRFGDMQSVRLALEGAFETIAAAPMVSAPTPPTRGRLVWMVALGVAIALIGVLAVPVVRHLTETATSAPPETRLDIVTPATDRPTEFALSPDGRQVVFVASGDGPSRLWLRSLSATAARPLAGTEGATAPFWAPDSRAVAFFADDKLQRTDINGGSPQTVATATGVGSGTWNRDGVILFASGTRQLFRVSASGGEVAAATKVDRHWGHRQPFFLPDSNHFLFYALGQQDPGGIHLGSLDSSVVTRLTMAPPDATEAAGVYLATLPAGFLNSGSAGNSPVGWILWVRAGTLVAQRLDLAQRVLTGETVALANPIAFDLITGRSALSVSATGVVAYRTGAASRRQLSWFDRAGKALGVLGRPDQNSLSTPSVSPDGRRVAVHRNVQSNSDIWLVDDTRTTRFTFDAAIEGFPLWSLDSRRIVFRSRRKGPFDLYQKSSSGDGADELLVESAQQKSALSWSPGGRFLLYQSTDPKTGVDLWVLPMEEGRPGKGQPSVFLKTPFAERWGRFSPDGRWVAYMSNESGQEEVYIRPFLEPPASGAATGATAGQWQVSTAGGIHPRWRPDGKELYYLSPAGEMMAASIAASGATVELGSPVRLFPTRINGGGVDRGQGPQYDVARDGRFLINTELDSANAPITLLMNWNPEGKTGQ